jgi:hypothetical protein
MAVRIISDGYRRVFYTLSVSRPVPEIKQFVRLLMKLSADTMPARVFLLFLTRQQLSAGAQRYNTNKNENS